MVEELKQRIDNLEAQMNDMKNNQGLNQISLQKRLNSQRGLSLPIYNTTPTRGQIGDVCVVLNSDKTIGTFKKCTTANSWSNF